MARTGNLKPGFFKNEDLAELPPITRLLFAGLWCWADRDGRLEDRPRRLKAEILPYDECDVDNMLRQLADSPGQFIIRYEIEGRRYITIPAFAAHQNPHQAEKPLGIPAPPQEVAGKNSVSTVQEPDKNSSKRALNLKPSASNLKPSKRESASPPLSPDGDAPGLTLEELVTQWNSTVGVCPCKKITKRRRDALRARCKDPDWTTDFPEALKRVAGSRFCAGENDRGWKANIDWFLRPDTLARLLEGVYDNCSARPDGRAHE